MKQLETFLGLSARFKKSVSKVVNMFRFHYMLNFTKVHINFVHLEFFFQPFMFLLPFDIINSETHFHQWSVLCG